MTSRQRLIDRLDKSAPSANNDLLEEVEICQSFSPPTSQNEFTTISGSTSSHTLEEASAAHNDLVVSVITTHSSHGHGPFSNRLVPPSSLSHRRSRSRTPEFFDAAALELPTCSPTYYECILSHVDSDDDDDQNNSTTSVGYFETTDFLESTWAAVVNESNMHYNLGMLALATTAVIVVHPLVLFAGAGVAAASFWAVGVFGDALNLEYFSDASFQQLFWKDAPKQEQILQKAKTIIDMKESNSTSPSIESEETPKAVLPPSKKELLIVPSLLDARLKSDITQQSSSNERILRHFPPLENEIVSQVEFPGMDAAQFFNVFFADDCPFTFKEFQKKRGDIDICYGKWGLVDQEPASLHMKATGPLLSGMQQRTLKFKTLTKSYFGPAYACAIKTQRVVMRRHIVILESRTRLEGIPFCDRFQVVERWIVETPRKCHYSILKVYSQVQFHNSCSFEGQICKKSLTTVKEVVTSWCEMAKEAIERTAAQKKGEEEVDDIVDDTVSSHGTVSTSQVLFEQHEEKLRRVEESILNGGLDSIEVQHCLSPTVAKVVNDEKPQEGIVIVSKKKSRIVALAGKVTTVSPKRSRSSLRGFGNSVRSVFSRKSSAPIQESSSSDD